MKSLEDTTWRTRSRKSTKIEKKTLKETKHRNKHKTKRSNKRTNDDLQKVHRKLRLSITNIRVNSAPEG